MADMDMGLFPPKRKKRNKKKIGVRAALFPAKGDSIGEAARKVVFLLAVTVLVGSVAILLFKFIKYQKLSNHTAVDSNGSHTATDAYIIELKNLAPSEENVKKLPGGTINTNFAALYAENSDFIGWLNIPGTEIDYPVMQTDDNEFYLRRGFRKEYLFSGTLFADYEGVISADGMPQNTIIYGHNIEHKYQFSSLPEYKNIERLKSSPVIGFDTLFGSNSYKIFSVFVTNIKREHGELFEYTKEIYFKNRDEFFNFVLECEDRSLYDTGVDIEYGDEFLTLSTCDRDTSMDLRLVIVARKIRDGEDPAVNTENIVQKDSVKYFKTFYSIFGEQWHGRTWDVSKVKGLSEYISLHGLEDEPKTAN